AGTTDCTSVVTSSAAAALAGRGPDAPGDADAISGKRTDCGSGGVPTEAEAYGAARRESRGLHQRATMIAFFGTGLLGSGFVRALRRRGQAVSVWNRTAAKARALEPTGALVIEDPAEAVRGAKQLHLVLSDDAAVDAVLERARPGFAPDLVIVDH